MRVLVIVAPTMYREALVHLVRTNRPNVEVHLADPQALDSEAYSFRPHLVVCNDDAPEIRTVSILSRVVIRYQNGLSASVSFDGRDPRLVQDMSMEDLLGVLDETQRLVAQRGVS